MKQGGYVYRKGNAWFLRYRDTVIENGKAVRKQYAKRLATVAPEHARLRNPPASILELAEDELRPVNDAKVTIESTQTLSQFVDGVYFPHTTTQKRASTVYTDRNRWKTHLKPRVGDVRLREFRTVTGEHLIADIARHENLSRATLKQYKSLLSAIFNHAKRVGLLDGANPMQDVSVPKSARGKKQTYAYSLPEIQAMFSVVPEPSRTVVAVAAYAGLRRGEIQGLDRPDYSGKQLNIERSVWEGVIDDPKSEASKDAVPVIEALARILDKFLHNKPSKGPMFSLCELRGNRG
jgi:integrase